MEHTVLCLVFRVVSAVYDMLGATGYMGKTQELFSKLDANSDGSISQEEFVAVIKKDKSLLDVLQGKQALVWKARKEAAQVVADSFVRRSCIDLISTFASMNVSLILIIFCKVNSFPFTGSSMV